VPIAFVPRPSDAVKISALCALARPALVGFHMTTFQPCVPTLRRWYNQLSPELKRGPFEAEEDRTIILAHAEFGNQWSRMAKLLPGRTDNAIKNRWHSALKRTVSEGLPAGGSGDLPPARASQQQPSQLAASYFGQPQRQASADSPAWRTSDPADSERQVRVRPRAPSTCQTCCQQALLQRSRCQRPLLQGETGVHDRRHMHSRSSTRSVRGCSGGSSRALRRRALSATTRGRACAVGGVWSSTRSRGGPRRGPAAASSSCPRRRQQAAAEDPRAVRGPRGTGSPPRRSRLHSRTAWT